MIRQKLVFFCIVIVSVSIWSQPNSWVRYPKPYKYMLAVSWHGVEDDGRGLCQPFNVPVAWNMPVFPAKINFQKHTWHSWALDLSASYAQYKLGKLINDSTNYEGMFLAFDVNYVFSFQKAFGLRSLDPFVSFGAGLTQRTAFDAPYNLNANLNCGLYYFPFRRIGIRYESSAKFGMYPSFMGHSSYFQHSLGLVYKAPAKKAYSSSRKSQHKWIKKRKRISGFNSKTK